EQVQEGMVEFGDHDHQALALALVNERRLHVEAGDGRLQRLFQRVAVHAVGRGKGEAHEEAAGFAIPELVALGDIGIEASQFGGDGGNNTGTISTAEGEDEIGRHGRRSQTNGPQGYQWQTRVSQAKQKRAARESSPSLSLSASRDLWRRVLSRDHSLPSHQNPDLPRAPNSHKTLDHLLFIG